MSMSRHEPVLLNEVITGLALKAGDAVVDGTLGDGGHSEALLKVIGPNGKLLAIDADPESLLRAKQYLYSFQNQVTFVRDNFVNLSNIATAHQFTAVKGILLDLGWSSPQFAERGRGFSFDLDEPLDMRFSAQSSGSAETAAEILNTNSVSELNRIFQVYGEEKFAQPIAEAVVEKRQTAPFGRTTELVEIILQVYRAKLHSTKEIPWIGGIHPATKVFQALRIAVNHELEVLEQVLPQALGLLAPKGRLAVITFHSLEDRIVKHWFKKPGIAEQVHILTKKPVVASEAELTQNPRSRSAKLRIIEKK